MIHSENIKQFLKDVLPPVLIRRALKFKNISFIGPFASWDEAKKHTLGYDNDVILKKCKVGMLKVASGEVAYERDSVLFDKIQYSFPVLAGLLHAAVTNGGCLSVLDFGGSLGTSYYQCRGFLGELKSLRWSIIEQPKFVGCGRELFETEELKFYYNIDECLTHEKSDVVLLSGVLQYLECPYEQLKDIIEHDFEYIILDRTPLVRLRTDILTAQNVPENIYKSSYPCWFLSEERLLNCFSARYNVLADFESIDTWELGRIRAQSKGYIFVNSNTGYYGLHPKKDKSLR